MKQFWLMPRHDQRRIDVLSEVATSQSRGPLGGCGDDFSSGGDAKIGQRAVENFAISRTGKLGPTTKLVDLPDDNRRFGMDQKRSILSRHANAGSFPG